MAMRLPIRQMNGKVMVLEVMPETTLGELKKQLSSSEHGKMTLAQLVMGEKTLEKNEMTMSEAGISQETSLHVIYRSAIQCANKSLAGCDVNEILLLDFPSIPKVEAKAFMDCSSLVKVKLPESVGRIEAQAFKGCTSLEELELPSKLINIATEAFQGCNSLVELQVPDPVPVIWPLTFDGCSSLMRVTLGQSVTLIEGQAFRSCGSLRQLILSHSVCYIGPQAFQGCGLLESVTVRPREEVVMDPETLQASRVQASNVPNHVRSISGEAFSGCSSLTSITVPSDVAVIEAGAFTGCSALKRASGTK